MHRDAAMCRTCSTAAGVWRGENSPVWKGGRTRLKNGYVMVQAFGHPRTTRYTNYVFEHILVMEEALGRYLDMDETVHHLNGVKEDNRVENLELWTKPQPSGIRATDAIAWAWAILSKYEGWEPFGPGPA